MSAESGVGDVTRPLKALLPGYRQIEDAVQHAVEDALDLPNAFLLNVHREVKAADDWALACEAWHLLPSRGATWFCADLYDADRDFSGWQSDVSPEWAREEFLRWHFDLKAHVDA